jgi:hypothetical protein
MMYIDGGRFKFGFVSGMHIPFTNQIHQWGRGPMGVSPMLPTIKSLGISMLFLKVFGVLRTFLQKGSKPPEAVLLVPLQTAIYHLFPPLPNIVP